MLTQGKTKQIWREDSEHTFKVSSSLKTRRTLGHAHAVAHVSGSGVFSQTKNISVYSKHSRKS